MTTAGILDLKDTIGPYDSYDVMIDCWVQDSIVFVTTTNSDFGRSYLRTYTYSVITGELTYSHSLEDGSGEFVSKNVFGDGSDVVFVVDPASSTSGIRSYTYTSGGTLTYKTAYTTGSYTYYNGVMADGYLFVVGSNGITSFTVNTTTGVLTYVDRDSTGSFTGNSITWDADNEVLYVGSQDDGMLVYTHSSGTLTQTYPSPSSGSGYDGFPAYNVKGNYLYGVDGSNQIARWRLSSGDDLSYIGAQSFNINNRLFIWENAVDILIATDGVDGIRTYTIDLD
jgi:hypothetical protein